MRSLVSTITLLSLLTVPSLACAGPSQDDPAKTLKAYYEGQKNVDYRAAVKKLATSGSAESDQAAAWLCPEHTETPGGCRRVRVIEWLRR